MLTDELEWNASAERVDRVEKMAFGAVVFDEARGAAPPSPAASAVLAAAARRGSVAVVRQERRRLLAHVAPAPAARALSGARAPGARRKLRTCHARLDLRRFDQLRRARRGRRAERAALGPERRPTTRARARDAGARALARRAHACKSTTKSIARLGSNRACRTSSACPRSPAVPRQGPAHLASARPEPARDAGDHGLVRLLGAALPEHSPRIDASLPAPSLAGRRPNGHAARATTAATALAHARRGTRSSLDDLPAD